MVQHYCAEEHRPAQFPAAIVVGLDEQLSLDEIPNPSDLKYSSLLLSVSFLSCCPQAYFISGPVLYQSKDMALCKIHTQLWAKWRLQQFEYVIEEKKSNFLLWAPSAKEKSTTLDRIFSFLMRPSCQYSLSPFRPGSSQMSFNFCFRTKEEILQRFKTSLQNILSHAAIK